MLTETGPCQFVGQSGSKIHENAAQFCKILNPSLCHACASVCKIEIMCVLHISYCNTSTQQPSYIMLLMMVIVSDFRTEQAKDSQEKCAAVEGGLWDIEP